MKILLSVPNQGWIHKWVTFAVCRILQDPRHRVKYIAPTWRPYEQNMNRIALDFVRSDFDYWLTIDDDNPPLRNPLDLVDHDLDIVGCPTPVWNDKVSKYPIYWNAMTDVGDGYVPNSQVEGLQEVDAVGSGCVLFRKDVLAAFKKPFERTTDENGLVVAGPDFNFCAKAKQRGFKVWAHYDYPCRHFGELDLYDVDGYLEKP